MTASKHPFESLTPARVVDAVESLGFWLPGEPFALNSYENRVFLLSDDDRRRWVAKFYRPARWSEAQIRDEVHRRLAAVGLEDVDDLLPGELSGGMLKRAALARAIILDPEILLCDEPFSGLDPPNVLRIEALLARLAGELGLTVIVTSHHVVTSRRMANQLMVLFPDGAVSGTPQELAMSRDPRINEFLGVQPEAETAGSDAGSTQPHLELG